MNDPRPSGPPPGRAGSSTDHTTRTKARRARFALDPLLTDMAVAEDGHTAERSAADADAQRVFCAGILAARAMIDAGRDIGFERWIHSIAVVYRDPVLDAGELSTVVDARDDSAFSARRSLTLRQSGRELAHASAAFEDPPTGRHHPHLYGIGDAPDPHALTTCVDVAGASSLPIDVRPVDWAPLGDRPRGLDAPVRSWFRFTDELPDDLLLHGAALALCVDPLITRNLLGVNAFNAGEGNPPVLGWRPLTYTLWIHRCFRADDWLLATEKSTSIFGNRAFFSVTLHSSQGRHVATAVEELKLTRPPHNGPS